MGQSLVLSTQRSPAVQKKKFFNCLQHCHAHVKGRFDTTAHLWLLNIWKDVEFTANSSGWGGGGAYSQYSQYSQRVSATKVLKP